MCDNFANLFTLKKKYLIQPQNLWYKLVKIVILLLSISNVGIMKRNSKHNSWESKIKITM